MKRLLLVCSAIALAGCAATPQVDASLRERARLGDSEAQYEVGEYHYRQRYSFSGNSSDWDAAAPWFEKAAAQGDARAHYRLAQYYFSHKADYARSFQWVALPAQEGIAEAQHLLGMHHAQGWGTPPDLIRAYKWIALASEGGVPNPIGSLADLRWLIARGRPTSAQIAEGQRLAAEHTAAYGRSRPLANYLMSP